MPAKIKKKKQKANFRQTKNAMSVAIEHHRAGRLKEAEMAYHQVLQKQPKHPVALNHLGLIANQAGDNDTAIYFIRKAIAASPDYTEAHNNLGVALKVQGRFEEAIACSQRALSLKPDYPEAFSNMGSALREQGRFEEAIACYQRALSLKPDYLEVLNNMGGAFREQGRFEEAIAWYRKALSLKPDYPEVLNNMGGAFQEQGRLEEAVACYRRAVALKPDYPGALNSMGNVLKAQGRFEEAVESYKKALDLGPKNILWRLMVDALCPLIVSSGDAIDRWRSRFADALNDYSTIDLDACLKDVPASNAYPSFNMAYHGRNDLKLKTRYAGLFSAAPRLRPATRGGEKRIGMVVTGGHEGVFLTITRGVLNNWSRKDCHVTIVCDSSNVGLIRSRIENKAIDYLVMPPDFPLTIQRIAAREFDLLYFWEVGTDSANYFLPFFRLAPVQCTSFGTSETTGIPQVDYFISSELFESEGAEAHYSEQLVRLKGLPAYLYRPALPAEPKGRGHFSLSEDEHIYLCPQQLFKFHPAFDRAIGEILRQDPKGVLVLKEGRHKHWEELLMDRFQKSIPDVIGRIRFLPQLSYGDYLTLMAVSDVMLDTFHYSGFNTTCEAVAVGTLVVTLPGEFQRARQTYAIYRKIGVMDTVAESEEDYIEKAVRFGTDRDYRQQVKGKIAGAGSVLFEDIESARELEDFFAGAIEKARPSDSDTAHNVIPIMTKPTVRVVHNMARSGGTVMLKCLGCMKDVVLLSEIHPAGTKWFNPLQQAHEWFNLLSPGDMQGLQEKVGVSFEDAIALIQNRCEEQNKTLVIRDWGHLDFTAVPFVEKPSYRLSTAEALGSRFEVLSTAIVRHPVDQWLSLRDLKLVHGKITLEDFLRGCLRFAEHCGRIGFVRYEDFVRAPEKQMQLLCERLNVDYDASFIRNWWKYATITGDTSSQRGHRAEIKPVPRRPMEDGLLGQFEKNPDYIKIIEILGYRHPG